MNPLPLVLADLRRNRLSSLCVVLLVAVAVALGVAVSAQERALRQGSAKAAEPFDLLIGAPGSATELVLASVYLQPNAVALIDGAILNELHAIEEVVYATPIGFGDNYQGHPIIGVVPAFLTDGGAREIAEGRAFDKLDEAVLGADVPVDLGASFTPLHGMASLDPQEDAHEGFAYTAVGRMPRQGNPWDQAILVPIEAVWWVHGLPIGHDVSVEALYPNDAEEPDFTAVPLGPPYAEQQLPGVPAIVVKVPDLAAIYGLRQQFRDRDDTMALTPAEVLNPLYNLLGDVRDLLAVISVLTQALVIAAVLLAVLATLAQRRKLIGTLRALGASRFYVFTVVWSGVALLLVIGSFLGLALGRIGAGLLSRVAERQTDIDLAVSITAAEWRLILVVIVVGLLLATLPAMLSYRGSAASALRG